MKHTKEAREKIKNNHSRYWLGKKNVSVTGEKNRLWKGGEVDYRNLHHWVDRHKGKPDTCEHCGRSGLTGRSIHWANISGNYKRDLDDFVRLCSRCHALFDKGKRNGLKINTKGL